MKKNKLRMGYGYWYDDKTNLGRSDFHSRYHLVEIIEYDDGSETVEALCGTNSEQEEYYKHRHYFDDMRFFDLVQKSGLRIDETIIACSGCLHMRWWAVLRDMVERIEEERC